LIFAKNWSIYPNLTWNSEISNGPAPCKFGPAHVIYTKSLQLQIFPKLFKVSIVGHTACTHQTDSRILVNAFRHWIFDSCNIIGISIYPHLLEREELEYKFQKMEIADLKGLGMNENEECVISAIDRPIQIRIHLFINCVCYCWIQTLYGSGVFCWRQKRYFRCLLFEVPWQINEQEPSI